MTKFDDNEAKALLANFSRSSQRPPPPDALAHLAEIRDRFLGLAKMGGLHVSQPPQGFPGALVANPQRSKAVVLDTGDDGFRLLDPRDTMAPAVDFKPQWNPFETRFEGSNGENPLTMLTALVLDRLK